MKKGIRRYDIFAICNYLEYLKKGYPEALAKGWAIWKAKVVASRKFGYLNIEKKVGKKGGNKKKIHNKKIHNRNEFPELSGKLQDDTVYNREIIDRFGEWNYNIILQEVKERLEQGKKYTQFRDTIRTELENILL